MPGLSILSSASASARADDGLCLLRDRYLGARACCARFAAAVGSNAIGAKIGAKETGGGQAPPPTWAYWQMSTQRRPR